MRGDPGPPPPSMQMVGQILISSTTFGNHPRPPAWHTTAVRHDSIISPQTPDIPFTALLFGALGFFLGILTMGRLTIKTVGKGIMRLTPSRSFATQMGAAIAVMLSSALGLPVSTSHCLVGSVVGIGAFEKMAGTGSVNAGTLVRIVLGWVITIPLAMGVALLFFAPGRQYYDDVKTTTTPAP